jgi:hypothetical protein
MDQSKQLGQSERLSRGSRWHDELTNLAVSCMVGAIALLGIALALFLFITFLPELVEMLQWALEPVLRALGAFLSEVMDRWA